MFFRYPDCQAVWQLSKVLCEHRIAIITKTGGTYNEKQKKNDAFGFAKLLKEAKLPNTILHFGNFVLCGSKGINSKIRYSEEEFEMLSGCHNYTFIIQQGELELSLQLYENISGHYRLFCYTNFNGVKGMTFSINITINKESEQIIYLTQTLKFSERYSGDVIRAKEHRRQKQMIFCNLLQKMEFDITENHEVILGIFDPIKGQLINTTPEKLINDFLVLSILKGHFQGNKGYQLEILPNFDQLNYSL